jgi:phosphatidylglycerophosphate synthase
MIGNNKHFTAKFFKDNLPEWKRQKDSFVLRHFTRPLSFFGASICARRGISANTVSYVSGIVALIACALFLPPNYICHIIGAILINFWIFMDCIDGNLARCVRKQPFGEFADGISSYLLVGFMCTCIAFAVYFEGGYFFTAGNPWIILLGALASSSDTMMRLIYHKYEHTRQDLIKKGVMPDIADQHTDIKNVSDWKTRVEHELGLDGILPLLILLCSALQILDIVVFYCFLYYGGSFVLSSLMFIKKAIKASNQYAERMPQ